MYILHCLRILRLLPKKKLEKLLKLEILERSVLGVWVGKSGLLEGMLLANQIQEFRILDCWEAGGKNNDSYVVVVTFTVLNIIVPGYTDCRSRLGGREGGGEQRDINFDVMKELEYSKWEIIWRLSFLKHVSDTERSQGGQKHCQIGFGIVTMITSPKVIIIFFIKTYISSIISEEWCYYASALYCHAV